MNWFLRGTTRADPNAPQPEALDAPLPSRTEQLRKSFVLERIKTDPAIRQSLIGREVFNEMVDAFGGRAALDDAGIRNYRPRLKPGLFSDSFDYAPVAALTDRIQQLRAFDPARFGTLPATVEEFEAEIQRRDKAEEDEVRALLDRGDSGLAQFAGGMAGAMTDPANIALGLLSGGTGTGLRGALTFAAREAALGAAGEVSSIAGQQARAERLGSPEPDVVGQLTMGAAGGFVLGAAIGGASNYLQYRSARKAAEAGDRPEDASGIDHETGIDTAETALRSGAEPPEIAANAPVGWAQIRNGIFAGESQGDYDALFGFSNRPGGDWQNVRLTEMTVDEAIAFSDPSGPYGQWVKARVGRVATPMGAYQIVGTTLRAAKKELGLTGAEKMTPELQERLGQWVYRAQGTGAWEGYRGPRDSFTPPPEGAAAPAAPASFNPAPLRRGQTAADEVVSPGGLRARVEYRVVDLSEIQQATGALQNRDRSRAASDEWVADTASRLDPAQLMPGPFANQGAPVVGPDGVIESGNGRVRVLNRAAETNPQAYAGYVDQIRAAGFDVPEGMQRPVLIAQRTEDWTPDQRRAWVVDNNAAATARMSSAEQAMTDADYLTPAVFDAFQPGARLGSAQNAGFARRFLGQLPPGERGAFYNKDGSLSVDGLLRLRRALLGRAFGADDIVRLAVESENRAVEGLLRMLEEVAPDWAAMRALAEQGYIRPEFDITDDLMTVVRAIAKARIEDRDGQSVIAAVRDALGQGDMFAAGPRDPALADALLGVFYKGERARSPDASADILRRYAAEAMQRGRPDSPDMIEAAPPSPAEALAAAVQGHDGRQPFTMPARPVPEPIEVPDIQAMDPGPLTDGTASPAVQRADDALAAELRETLAAAAPNTGPFGPVYTEFSNDWKAAVDHLLASQTGEVPNVLRHPDVKHPETGEPLGISLIYGVPPGPGVEGSGLAKIAAKHPEALADLPGLISRLPVNARRSGKNRITLEDGTGAAIVRLDYADIATGQKHEATWLLTAFEKAGGANRAATTDTGIVRASDDTAGRGVGTADNMGDLFTSDKALADAADQSSRELSARIDAARLDEPQASAEMRALDDTPIPLGDGEDAQKILASDLLAELDADEGLIAAMRVCHLGGTGQ